LRVHKEFAQGTIIYSLSCVYLKFFKTIFSMKKIIFSFLLLAVSAGLVNAKVWQVANNNVLLGIVADFNNIADAITAAAPGDTLYIEGSVISYGDITLQKKLVFIGPGYFLNSVTGNPGLQARSDSAFINSFNIDSSASGSVFLGLVINQIFPLNNTGYGADNITISGCYLRGNGILFNSTPVAGTVAANWSITKCYFDGSLDVQGMNLQNWNVSNSIFNNDLNLHNTANGSSIMRNNVYNNYFGFQVYNTYFTNNILNTYYAPTLDASVVKNNLAVGTPSGFASFAGLNSNQWGFTAAQLFQGPTGNSLDGQWRLAAGSPAIGAGLPVGSVTTIDAGAFGGPDPYRLSGIPDIPTIYSLTVPETVPTGQTLNIIYNTRSN
jgi:hypothetical protein